MRIGELAELAGVTTRTVRHYHHLGLLPEPLRRANGYRDYGLRHAVLLARIRRLTELGLGLAEVRDVLADDAGRELTEVLAELDADLARQQRALAARRAQVAALIERARAGRLPPEGPVSPELAELFGTLGGADSPMAAKDRSHLALLDSLADPAEREPFYRELRARAAEPGFTRSAEELYRRLDELADARPDDPRVAPLAADLAALLPGLLRTLAAGPAVTDTPAVRALLEDLAPAQAEVIRRMLTEEER